MFYNSSDSRILQGRKLQHRYQYELNKHRCVECYKKPILTCIFNGAICWDRRFARSNFIAFCCSLTKRGTSLWSISCARKQDKNTNKALLVRVSDRLVFPKLSMCSLASSRSHFFSIYAHNPMPVNSSPFDLFTLSNRTTNIMCADGFCLSTVHQQTSVFVHQIQP